MLSQPASATKRTWAFGSVASSRSGRTGKLFTVPVARAEGDVAEQAIAVAAARARVRRLEHDGRRPGARSRAAMCSGARLQLHRVLRVPARSLAGDGRVGGLDHRDGGLVAEVAVMRAGGHPEVEAWPFASSALRKLIDPQRRPGHCSASINEVVT